MSRGGLLIWNDCKPDALEDYERWYQEEHLPERVGILGYRFGVRYEALDSTASPRFFTRYEVASPEVLLSPAYRGILAEPSPWTQRVMPNFANMSRTLCRRQGFEGIGVSGLLVTLTGPDGRRLGDVARSALGRRGCLGWSLWQAVEEPSSGTSEMALRGGGDQTIEAALLLQVARAADAEAWTRQLRSDGEARSYGLISVMTAEEARRIG